MKNFIKHKRYFILLLWCVITGLVIYYRKDGPIFLNDSLLYTEIAQEINTGKWPNFFIRTPSYPTYLSLFTAFGTLKFLLPVTIILNSIGSLAYLWFLDKVSRFKWLNTIIIGFIYTFAVNSYQNVLLTESIGYSALIFSFFFNFQLAKNKQHTKIIIFLCLISDIFLMFLKPQFIFLPIIFKLYLLAQKIIFKNNFKVNPKPIFVTLISCLILLISLPTYNYVRHSKFEISCINTINTFWIAMKLGFLNFDPMYKDIPPNVLALMKDYEDRDQPPDPFVLNGVYIFFEENIKADYTAANKYFFSYPQNRRKYILHIINIFPKIFSDQDKYLNLDSKVTSNKLFMSIYSFFSKLDNFKFIAFMGNLIIYLYYLYKRNTKSVYLGMSLLTVFLIIISTSTFAPNDFNRLIQPAQFFINIFIFLLFLNLKLD